MSLGKGTLHPGGVIIGSGQLKPDEMDILAYMAEVVAVLSQNYGLQVTLDGTRVRWRGPFGNDVNSGSLPNGHGVVVRVLEGRGDLKVSNGMSRRMTPGSWAYMPAGMKYSWTGRLPHTGLRVVSVWLQ